MSVKRTGQFSFVDVLMPSGWGQNERLGRLTELVKWYRFEKLLSGMRSEGPGRPGYLPLAMFKALLLQSLYGLSDAELEAALGDGEKRVEANELETVVVQRRSVRLRFDLPAGHALTPDDLESLRPCPADAVDPRRLGEVLGRTLKAAGKAGDAVRWTDLA